jgi:hypothetical protein
VLKGLNILASSIQQNETVDGELQTLLDREINILFKLTHHDVLRISIQSLKLLYQFSKTKGLSSTSQESGGTFKDRFYRAMYELILHVNMK